MAECKDGDKDKPQPPPRPNPQESSEKKSWDPLGEKAALPKPQTPETAGGKK